LSIITRLVCACLRSRQSNCCIAQFQSGVLASSQGGTPGPRPLRPPPPLAASALHSGAGPQAQASFGTPHTLNRPV
jgi:hypothetical protein